MTSGEARRGSTDSCSLNLWGKFSEKANLKGPSFVGPPHKRTVGSFGWEHSSFCSDLSKVKLGNCFSNQILLLVIKKQLEYENEALK